MKLKVAAFAYTVAVIWGIAVLGVGLANLAWPTYGVEFLRWIGSIYPGYHAASGFGSVVVGTLYALCDGACGGALVAWLYNCFAAAPPSA